MPPKGSATPAVMTPAQTRATTSLIPQVYSKKNRDKLAEANGLTTNVHNAEDAMELLVRDAHIERDGGATPNRIAYALLRHAAASAARIPAATINFIRAVAFTVEELDYQNRMGKATETIAERTQEAVTLSVTEPISRLEGLLEGIGERGERMGGAMAAMAEAVEKLQSDINSLATRVQGMEGPASSNADIDDGVATQEAAMQREQRSYVEVARDRARIPAEHAATIAKGDMRERQIVVQTDSQASAQSLTSLTEKELVEKANIALELMTTDPREKPAGATFVSALKTKTGSVIYTLNSEPAARYLRKDKTMREFIRSYGGTSTAAPRTCQLIVEFVPVDFQPEDRDAWQRVEQASNMPEASICEARWIKPAHLRSQGQRLAFLVLGVTSREAANHALEYGVILEGRPCKTRKLLPEPTRCMKCQTFGHIAKECKSIHDVCARCAGMHRTADPACKIDGKGNLKCANCNEAGHGAADRTCRVFKEKLQSTHERNPDAKYRLFPTSEPRTWDRPGQGTSRDGEFDRAWTNDNQRNGAPHADQGKGKGPMRQGRGHLAGGKRGEGGGARPTIIARPESRATENGAGTQARLDELWPLTQPTQASSDGAGPSNSAGSANTAAGPSNAHAGPSWADDRRTDLGPLPGFVSGGATGEAAASPQTPEPEPEPNPPRGTSSEETEDIYTRL
jgi:hypothetical protein